MGFSRNRPFSTEISDCIRNGLTIIMENSRKHIYRINYIGLDYVHIF